MSFLQTFTENLPEQTLKQKDANIAFIKTHGLPKRSEEDWKYTSLKAIEELDFNLSSLSSNTIPDSLFNTLKSKLCDQYYDLVIINGRLNQNLSANFFKLLESSKSGVALETKAFSEKSFRDSLQALNSLYCDNKISLNVHKNFSVEKPIRFLYFNFANENINQIVANKIQITVGEASKVDIIEEFISDESSQALSSSTNTTLLNVDVEISVENSATLNYTRIQTENENANHFGRTHIKLNKFSNLVSLSYSDGAKLSRHTLIIDLNQEEANAKVLGAYLVHNTQQADHYTTINHNVGNCTTEQLYKGILDDQSKAVFSGKVYIHKDAQKASSEQLNKNLLLSSKAEIDTKPQLEIFADDVKATHGATIGQLNPDELFYLQSRAIKKDTALAMLSTGFVSDVIEIIENVFLKKTLEQRIFNKLKQYSTPEL